MKKFAASMVTVLGLAWSSTLTGVSPAGAAQAKPQASPPAKSWCAAYHCGGENCGFSTHAQCTAAVSGAGGFCTQR